MVKIYCKTCKKKFFKNTSRIRKCINNFCSRKCEVKFRSKYENIRNCKELGYFIGVMFGDGSKHKSKRGQYSLYLHVKDKDFSDKFQNCIFKITKVLPKQRLTKDIYGRTLFLVKFHSKILYNLCLKNSNEIIKQYPIEFLKGIFDSEGYVSLNKSKKKAFVGLGMINKKIIINIVNILKSIKIKYRIYIARTKATNLKYYKILIHDNNSLKIFRKRIGFSIYRKNERLLLNKYYIDKNNYKNG